MTQEFHISITSIGNGEYSVRTEDVAPGVPLAEEQVIWPVDNWLQRSNLLMSDRLLGSLQNQLATSAPPSQTAFKQPPVQNASDLELLGQELYDHLFQRTIRESWIAAQGIAQNRREVLRLRLALKDQDIRRLPWEILHIGGLPLATGKDIAFSRYQPDLSSRKFLLDKFPSDLSLKVLMVMAVPNDQENLALRTEVNRLKAELRRPQGPQIGIGQQMLPEMEVTVLDQPSREQLTQAVEQGHYQVLHYAGHSSLGQAGGNLHLVNHETGLTEILSGQDLAGLLVNNGIRLVVLNSCRGAYIAPFQSDLAQGEMSLVQTLIGRGIPGVLAMAERIPDDVALTLTTLLYRNLRQGYPIDLSLSRARQGLISTYGSRPFYWALPILYLHERFNGELSGVQVPVDLMADLPVFSTDVSPLVDNNERSQEQGNQPRLLQDDLGVITHGEEEEFFLSDDPDDWLDPSDADDGTYDQDYESDLADVAGMFSQLSGNGDLGGSSTIASQDQEPLWPDSGSPSNAGMYAQFPENPAYQATDQNRQPVQSVEEHPSQPEKLIDDHARRESQSRKRWILGSIVGVGLAALLGVSTYKAGLFPSRSPSSPVSISFPDAKEELTDLAIRELQQEDLTTGQAAISELLNRGALEEAQSALTVVSEEQRTRAGVRFLNGRLAWQFVNAGNQDYSIEDARRAWTQAVEGNGSSVIPAYYNALGFAFYMEGEVTQATQAWMQAIDLADERQKQDPMTTSAIGTAEALNAETTNPDILTAYAGLALALVDIAEDQAWDERQNSLSKADKLYQLVITNDHDLVESQGRDQDWLWNEQILEDWTVLPEIVAPH